MKEVRVPYGIAVQRRHLGFVSDRQAAIQLVTKRRCGRKQLFYIYYLSYDSDSCEEIEEMYGTV